jgi:hypothetical protein
MIKFLVFLLFIFCSSCSLFNETGLRKSSVYFNNPQGSETMSLMVPKGYRHQQINDSAKGHLYLYPNGAFLYFVQLSNSGDYQVINKEANISQPQLPEGLFYKGQDSTGRFWREVQLKNFRFGYRNVTSDQEIKFDSSLNYAAGIIK